MSRRDVYFVLFYGSFLLNTNSGKFFEPPPHMFSRVVTSSRVVRRASPSASAGRSLLAGPCGSKEGCRSAPGWRSRISDSRAGTSDSTSATLETAIENRSMNAGPCRCSAAAARRSACCPSPSATGSSRSSRCCTGPAAAPRRRRR